MVPSGNSRVGQIPGAGALGTPPAGSWQGQPGAGQEGASGAAPGPGIGHLPEDGDRLRSLRWAWLSRAHHRAGHGSGELDTGPAAALRS